MTTNMSQAETEAEMFAEGVEALKQALATAGLAYATDRCMEEYLRMLDAALLAADAAGLSGSDRRAWLAWADGQTRGRVLEEATRRRDAEVLFANRQLTEWKRMMAARARSLPRGLHQFKES
jgi:hypothetical protein